MSDRDLFDAVAQKTGEDSLEIRRRGFSLAELDDTGPDHDPECLFDLIDLPEAGTVDWDALGFGCREPFYDAPRKNRRAAGAGAGSDKKPGSKKQLARAA
jgi:hypothetical protein